MKGLGECKAEANPSCSVGCSGLIIYRVCQLPDKGWILDVVSFRSFIWRLKINKEIKKSGCVFNDLVALEGK